MNSPAAAALEKANVSDDSTSRAAIRDVEIITPPKQYSDVDDNDSSVDNTGEEDIGEIKELQRALEYLISDSRRSNINNDDQEKQQESSVIAAENNKSGVDADDETLCQIPSLVNQILVEHYSVLPMDQSQKSRGIPYSTQQKMTELLIAVIVEFAEPHFHRVNRRRQEERKNLMQQGKEGEPQKKKSKKEKDDGVLSSKITFEDRAVSWATQCLKLLLQPRLSPSIQSNNEGEKKTENNDIHIPELEALLAATGSNDGFDIEQRMQEALLLGVQARNMLIGAAFPSSVRE